MEIKQAKDKEDFQKCWEVVRELRPHLDPDRYLTFMLYMIDEGYKLIYIELDGKVASICGYRPMTKLYTGRIIYIDDLSTLPEARGKGFASLLLKHVFELAKKEEMNGVHLDSGHMRFDAHRLYLNEGFRITSHHFSRNADVD